MPISMPSRARTMPSSSFHYDIGNEFASFLNNPRLHDLLVCSDQQTFYAHQDILRSRSAFLDELFRSPGFLQREQQQGIAVIDLNQHPDVVINALRFIYTGKIDEPDVYHVLDLARLARSLKLSQLESLLRRRFGRLVTEPVQERDDRDECSERGEEEYGTEGCEGATPSGSANVPVFRLARREPFLDASRMEGRVQVVIGRYRFRRQSAVLLAARSSYFNSLIVSNCQDIEVTGIPVEHIVLALRFIRAEGDENIPCQEKALQLLGSSQCLEMPSLTAYCEHVLHTRFMSVDTVCTIWNIAEGSEFLHEQCLGFVQDHFLEIASRDSFLDLDYHLLKCALNNGRINASAVDMVEALREWAVAHTRSSRREEVSPSVDDTDISHKAEQLLLTFLPPQTMFNLFNRLSLLGVAPSQQGLIA